MQLDAIRISPLQGFTNKFPSAVASTNFGKGDDFLVIRLYSGDNLVSSVTTKAFSRDGDHLFIELGSLLDSDSVYSGIFQMEIQGYRWVYPSPLIAQETSPNEVRLLMQDVSVLKDVNTFLALSNYDQADTYFHQFHLLEDSTEQRTLPITGKFVDAITEPNFPYSLICRTALPPNPDVEIYRVVEQIIDPVILTLKVVPAQETNRRLLRPLRPDFFVKGQNGIGTNTDYLNHNEIINSTDSDNQLMLDATVSKSVFQENLVTDYTSWHNFIKFSSARKRLEVFWRKLEDIEYYASKSFYASGAYAIGDFTASAGVSASLNAQREYQYWEKEKLNIISNFDGYEKWLYYESGSKPFPKVDANRPHVNLSVSSSEASAWRTTWYESASEFDLQNSTNLLKTVPYHIVDDTGSTDYLTFVQMTGHYFDQMYEYVDGLHRITKRTEKYAVPPKLLYDVAEGYAWKLASGFNQKSLQEFYLGKLNGEYQNTGQTALVPLDMAAAGYAPSAAGERLRNEIWQRVVNTLPYIYETKGTHRAIRSFTNAYGIPSSILQVNEFSVQSDTNFTASLYKYERPAGSVSNGGNPISFVYVDDTPNTIKTIEYRVKLSSVYTESWISNYTHSFLTLNDVALVGHHTSGGYMSFGFADNGGALADVISIISPTVSVPILDDNFWHHSIRYDSNTASFALSTVDDFGSIQYFSSAESTASVVSESFGDPSAHQAIFGALSLFEFNELRQWTEYLDDETLREHTRNPISLEGVSVSSSYYGLHRRFEFWSTPRPYVIFTSSTHYNEDEFGVREDSTVLFSPDGYAFNYFPEDTWVKLPFGGSDNLDSNKIRCLDSNISGNRLEPFETRVTASDFPAGSDRVFVGFNPAHHQNIHLANIFGELDLAQYINPTDQYSASYYELDVLKDLYTETLEYKINLNGFLRSLKLFDESIFYQICKLLPARATCDVGYAIEPMFFERPKFFQYDKPSASYHVWSGSISTGNDSYISTSYEAFYDITHSVFGDDGYDQRWLGSRYEWDNIVRSDDNTTSMTMSLNGTELIPSGVQNEAINLFVNGVAYPIENINANQIMIGTGLALNSESNYYISFEEVISASGSFVDAFNKTGSDTPVTGTLTSSNYINPTTFGFTGYDIGNATVENWRRITAKGGSVATPFVTSNGTQTDTALIYSFSTASSLARLANVTLYLPDGGDTSDWMHGIYFEVTELSASFTTAASPIIRKKNTPPFPVAANAGTMSLNGTDYDIVKRIDNYTIQIDTDVSFITPIEYALTYTDISSFSTNSISAGDVNSKTISVKTVRWAEALMPFITGSYPYYDRLFEKSYASGGTVYSRSYEPSRISVDHNLQGKQNRLFGTAVCSSVISVPPGTDNPLIIWRDASGAGYFYASSSDTYDNGPAISIYESDDLNDILITGN